MVQQKHSLLSMVFSRRRGFYVACVGISLLIIGAANHTAVIGQLHTWKVLPQADAYTELYFTGRKAPPGEYIPGKQQSITFSVHNVTGHAATYYYTVTQENEEGNSAQILGDGTIPLHNGELYHQTATITPQDTGNRTHITITLQPGGQHISFWQEKRQ